MFTSGILAGYGIAIPVGAIAVLIVGVGMRRGFALGLSAGAGAATVDLVYATVAAVAGVAVADVLQPWESEIRLGSALVLTAIAAWGLSGIHRSVRPGTPATAASTGELLTTYGRFVALTALNPLTVVYFAGLVMGSAIGRPTGAGEVALFALGAFVASLSWQSFLAAIGAYGRRGLPPRARVVTLVLGNLVILGMAIGILINR